MMLVPLAATLLAVFFFLFPSELYSSPTPASKALFNFGHFTLPTDNSPPHLDCLELAFDSICQVDLDAFVHILPFGGPPQRIIRTLEEGILLFKGLRLFCFLVVLRVLFGALSVDLLLLLEIAGTVVDALLVGVGQGVEGFGD